MILSRKLKLYRKEEAETLNWCRLTHNYNEAFIEAFVAMQTCTNDKIAVIDLISQSLKNENYQYLFGEQKLKWMKAMKQCIQKGLFSSYDVIMENVNKLEKLKTTGNKHDEEKLLQSIVTETMSLGIEAAQHIEIILRRIYSGEQTETVNQFLQSLKEYINNYTHPNCIIEKRIINMTGKNATYNENNK